MKEDRPVCAQEQSLLFAHLERRDNQLIKLYEISNRLADFARKIGFSTNDNDNKVCEDYPASYLELNQINMDDTANVIDLINETLSSIERL